MTSAEITASQMEQPVGLCDLIGLAFRIWRAHLPLILKTLWLPTVFFYVGATTLQWCFTYGITAGSEMPKILGIVSIGLLALAVYLISSVILYTKQLAMVRYFTGFSNDWQKSLLYAKKKTWWVLGYFAISVLMWSVLIGIWVCAMVLSGVFAGAGGPAGAVIGSMGIIFGVFGMIITIGLMTMVSLMGLSVLSCEETTFFGVIGQSFHWTFKHFGRVLCFGCVFYVVFWAVTMPVSLPVIIVSVVDSMMKQGLGGAAADYKVSIPAMIFIQLWEGLSSLLLRPVTMISFGLLYLDLRQRADGLDLTRKLNELIAASSGDVDGIQRR